MKTKPESRHGKIAEGSRRRQLLATEAQWQAWDAAAHAKGLLFSEWARRLLDAATSPPQPGKREA